MPVKKQWKRDKLQRLLVNNPLYNGVLNLNNHCSHFSDRRVSLNRSEITSSSTIMLRLTLKFFARVMRATGYGNSLLQFRVYVYSLIKFDDIKDILFHTPFIDAVRSSLSSYN